ncbi:actin cytoskeleton-regulatory complex protein PAN1-like [Impatiens glandulifera]|uniref:actin cytoskeleton-regulatory complex protein PAN1-like n=1 Tax=Impatiens glandulifera TaxID=253017 RepID=UPI001FB16C53|nr:actin cytoskeleton-regulatory complex protein PAN1-like [Impatiens glandulifera]
MDTRNKKKRSAVKNVIKRAEQRAAVPVVLNAQPLDEEEDAEELNQRKRRTTEGSTATPSVRQIIALPPPPPKPVCTNFGFKKKGTGHSSVWAGMMIDAERREREWKKNASLEKRNEKLEADLKAVTEQVNELMKAKLAADTAVEEANARAAKDIQDALDEETRKAKEAPRLSEADLDERARNIAARNPELAKIMAAKQVKEANRLKAQQDTYHNYETAHEKAASSSSVPATRKRKTPSRNVQVTEMLERITDTNIETPPNPALQTEDEIEENLEPRSTRQRVLNTVPISTVGQPQARGSSSRTAQPDEEQPTDDMMKDFLPSESK